MCSTFSSNKFFTGATNRGIPVNVYSSGVQKYIRQSEEEKAGWCITG